MSWKWSPLRQGRAAQSPTWSSFGPEIAQRRCTNHHRPRSSYILRDGCGRVRPSRGYAALVPVDFEAEGLLDDLHDPCERAERIALLHHLLQRGVPLEDLRRAAAEGRLVLLAVERALDATGEAVWAPTDVAAQTASRSPPHSCCRWRARSRRMPSSSTCAHSSAARRSPRRSSAPGTQATFTRSPSSLPTLSASPRSDKAPARSGSATSPSASRPSPLPSRIPR